MKPRFPLGDVIIRLVDSARKVERPEYADSLWQMNQHEFAMQVDGVGSFYACNGNEVEYSPLPSATPESVELYLNGSVYGAILHQRKILPMHGSSFIYNNIGIMVCGESGTGKSALTAAFCADGAIFLTDDVTPVVFKEGKPFILALSDRIKLWGNTFEQLGIPKEGLRKIDPETDKFYFPVEKGNFSIFPLNCIYIINIHDKNEIAFDRLTGASKFTTLRNEIYRWEYLAGMPENETVYFRKLCDIAENVKISIVRRSPDIPVMKLMTAIKNDLYYCI